MLEVVESETIEVCNRIGNVPVDSENAGLIGVNGTFPCQMPMQTNECDSISSEEPLSQISLCNEMLDYVAKSLTAHFKSQQVNEPELDNDQKRQIAKDVLAHSPAQFLCRFGRHLELKHLEYFSSMKQNDYEIDFYLRQLGRFHCTSTKQVDVKNRRFEAFKKLINEGTYFSETEMKNRNPLLYEQLIGRYLTQREIEERQHEAMVVNSTLVSVLLAQIEQEQTNVLRKKQKDDEEGAGEEVDTSENESEEDEEMSEGDEADLATRDEFSESGDEQNEAKIPPPSRKKMATHAEKELLKEEFYSFMYNSFLDGKDVDFDYGQVDFNPEFECLTVMSQDAEEKYFDSETPEDVTVDASEPRVEPEALAEEDELDVFMKTLKAEPTPTELAGQIQEL